MFLLLCLPLGCGHPFGSIVSFVTIDRERRFPLEVVSCTMSPPISGGGGVSSFSYVLCRFVGAPSGW